MQNFFETILILNLNQRAIIYKEDTPLLIIINHCNYNINNPLVKNSNQYPTFIIYNCEVLLMIMTNNKMIKSRLLIAIIYK